MSRPGPDDKITVAAHRKIDSDNDAQEKEYLASAPVTVSKEGNTVTVRARRQNKDKNLNWSGPLQHGRALHGARAEEL